MPPLPHRQMSKKSSKSVILGPVMRSLLRVNDSSTRKSDSTIAAYGHSGSHQLGCLSLLSCTHCGTVELTQAGRLHDGLATAVASSVQKFFSKQSIDSDETIASVSSEESVDNSSTDSSRAFSDAIDSLAELNEAIDEESSLLSELSAEQVDSTAELSDHELKDDNTNCADEATLHDDAVPATIKNEHGNDGEANECNDALPKSLQNLFDEEISASMHTNASPDEEEGDDDMPSEQHLKNLFENIKKIETLESVKSVMKVTISSILSEIDYVDEQKSASSKSSNGRKGRQSKAASKSRLPTDPVEEEFSNLISDLYNPCYDSENEEARSDVCSASAKAEIEESRADDAEVMDSQPTEPKQATEEAEPTAPEGVVEAKDEIECKTVDAATADEEVDLPDDTNADAISSPSASKCTDLFIRAGKMVNGKVVPFNVKPRVLKSSSGSSEESSDRSDSESLESNSLLCLTELPPSESPGDVTLSTGKARRKRVRVYTSEEESDQLHSCDSGEAEPDSKRRRKRKTKAANKLEPNTIHARKLEMERRKRIEERQKLYNNVPIESAAETSGLKEANFVLEMSEDGNEPAVVVHEELANCMKTHQRRGLQFLYDNTIESFKKINTAGNGCILAHSMGLGKSLQVIAYLHVVMTNEHLGVKSALILSPLGVVLNWKNEFDLWLFNKGLYLQVFAMSCLKSSKDRIMLLKNWKTYGGVLIMGYDMFRIMVNNTRNANHKAIVSETLLTPGPDVVICDEAHILKNDQTGISKALNQIRTKRRICLTGTPLQNSLLEYYCMVNFVKPNLLGTKKNFSSTFVNPIRNGQMSDSTPHEVKVMKRRSHVLHKLLSGFVQRVGYDSLEEPLFMKHEYVLYVRLSPEQVNLYNRYLDVVVENLDIKSLKARNSLFQDFQCLQLVWSHPKALLVHEAESSRKSYKWSSESEEEEMELTSTTSSSSSSSSSSSNSVNSESPPILNVYNCDDSPAQCAQPTDDDVVLVTSENDVEGVKTAATEEVEKPSADPSEWFKAITAETDCDRLELSGKLVLLFKILEKCAEIGDKLLVFSQSLFTLTLIEEFLALHSKDNEGTMDDDDVDATDEANLEHSLLPTGRWVRGMDYLRLDGSTPPEVRRRIALRFNNTNDMRCRLLLVSIRAGSLGINLIGSNRVVIFDANWNPTHEMQAMFRVIRLGQTKPVYVYRFIAQQTMESVIYGRQVVKQSLAYRVVDDWQIERHFSDILSECGNWIAKYHEHDSLLKNIVEETLTEEEMKAAWAEYEMEKQQTDLEKRIAILNLRASATVTTTVNLDVDTFAESHNDRTTVDHNRLAGMLEYNRVSTPMWTQRRGAVPMVNHVSSTSSTAQSESDVVEVVEPSIRTVQISASAPRGNVATQLQRLFAQDQYRRAEMFQRGTAPTEKQSALKQMLQTRTVPTNGHNWRAEAQGANKTTADDLRLAQMQQSRITALMRAHVRNLLEQVHSSSEASYMLSEFEKSFGMSGFSLLSQYVRQNPMHRITAKDVPMLVDSLKHQLLLQRQQQQAQSVNGTLNNRKSMLIGPNCHCR
ncbi:hypothetical protein M513_03367 [Trichuris suis]|uniref:Protein, SNF2 family n=1 Tax=Trichuris suis TaxID=68888 RepID=A0A085MEH3_9BILA|nr:hypothetical protein M513_03367 [Trichuris suis]